MKRRVLAAVTLAAAASLLSSCSITQVTLWFKVRNKTITTQEAKTYADLVNKDKPASCDSNYLNYDGGTPKLGERGCVPENAAELRCWMTAGTAPEIRGPIRVKGWDHFGIAEPTDSKYACVSPVGPIETFQQLGEGNIRTTGWAYDPDSDDSVSLETRLKENVQNAGTTKNLMEANKARPDLTSLGLGTSNKRGFDEDWVLSNVPTAGQPGKSFNLCIRAIDEKQGMNRDLGCKDITILPLATLVNAAGKANPADPNSQTVKGLLETAVIQKDGDLRGSGFAFFTTIAGNTTPTKVFLKTNGGGAKEVDVTASLTERKSVTDDYTLAAGTKTAFSGVIPKANLGTNSTQICMHAQFSNETAPSLVQCRNLETADALKF